MASMTSFTGIRASSCSGKATERPMMMKAASSSLKLGVVVAATAASAMLVGNAMGMEVVQYNSDGLNLLLPKQAAAGGPQDVAKISMPEEEYLNCAPRQGPHMDAEQLQRKLLSRLLKPW